MRIIKKLAFAIMVAALAIPVSVSATASTITLINPSGGEAFKTGDTMSVKWSSTGNISNVDLQLTGYKNKPLIGATPEQIANEWCLIANINLPDGGGIYLPNNGKYDFTIYKEDFSDLQGNLCKYYTLGVNGKDTDATDTSDYFTLSENLSAQPIHVISPNGGESYKVGDTVPIKWSSTVSNTKKVVITVHKLKNTAWVVPADPNSTDVDQYFADNGSDYIYTADLADILNSGNFNWVVPGQFSSKSGNYVLSISVYDGRQFQDWSDKYFTIGTSAVAGGAHPEGTNVLGPTGIVYRIVDGKRAPYTSAGAFLSYKFNTWGGVIPANSADLALPEMGPGQVLSFIPPREGSLILDKGTVYLISGGGRAGFATEAVFKGLGFTYKNVYPGDTSFMATETPITSIAKVHPDGVLIKNNGTFYLMENDARLGFTNMAILDSWGYWVDDAVQANSYDLKSAITGVVPVRGINQMSY